MLQLKIQFEPVFFPLLRRISKSAHPDTWPGRVLLCAKLGRMVSFVCSDMCVRAFCVHACSLSEIIACHIRYLSGECGMWRTIPQSLHATLIVSMALIMSMAQPFFTFLVSKRPDVFSKACTNVG